MHPESDPTSQDESLDPDDWAEARRLGHQMIDDMMDYLETVRERPAWHPVPSESLAALSEPVPYEGASLEDVYKMFRTHILPYPTGNIHPRFFGWVMGNGTPTGMLADMLAAGMNAHVGGFDQAAAVVERQVLIWLAELMGYSADASGLLVSGGSMANLNGLAVARTAKAGFNVCEQGLQDGEAARLTVYGSAETHGWIYKACDLLGLGHNGFRSVPVTADYQIDVDACRSMIQQDVEDGCRPFCIIGNVGTVNTGAIDNIDALRRLADEANVWLHIDGAFGALAALSPVASELVTAQSHADSIAFDLHKWGYMPYEVGCVLIRDPSAQTATFGAAPSFLTSSQRGISVKTTFFADRGLQLSRGFRALKVWMSLKEQGVRKIGRVIQQNIDQAQYLESLVNARQDLELLAPVPLNIVCFRYKPTGISGSELDALNQEILFRIQESGEAVPSSTVLDGCFAIRVCITNHRSRKEDFDRLISAVMTIALELNP